MTLPIPPAEPRAPRSEQEFVQDHQAGVWRYLRLLRVPAADVDDLLQDTFLTLLRRFRDPPAEPTALLRSIARGLWIDRLRWLARRRAVERADLVDQALAETPDDPHLALWIDALAACRERLTDRARHAVDLAYRDGLDRDTIARELGIATSTAKNLLVQAKKTLKECIEARMRRGGTT